MRKYVFLLVFVFLFVGLSSYGYCHEGSDVVYLSNIEVDSGERIYVKLFGIIGVDNVRQQMEQFINSGLYEIVAVKTKYHLDGTRLASVEIYYRIKTPGKTKLSE